MPGRERTGAGGHVCACLLMSVYVCLSAHVCTCLSQSADGLRRERTGSERGVDWGGKGEGGRIGQWGTLLRYASARGQCMYA